MPERNVPRQYTWYFFHLSFTWWKWICLIINRIIQLGCLRTGGIFLYFRLFPLYIINTWGSKKDSITRLESSPEALLELHLRGSKRQICSYLSYQHATADPNTIIQTLKSFHTLMTSFDLNNHLHPYFCKNTSRT